MRKFTIRALVLTYGLLFFSSGVWAQYYSSGQDPTSVKWEQINTPHFKVIFPDGYERTGQYVANVLEYAAKLDTITLKAKVKKIPVILHNQTAISNAQTLWAPRRMDFYTIPPQDSYGQEWFQQLALHEYRHVIQLSKLNQGLTNVLTYVFGEQVTGAVLGLYVPLWFLEGDAVAAETELSKVGRGRSPGFAMPLRAQFINEKIYSYDKAVFGSYKNFIPNRYILGYHIVAKARGAYGTEIWNHTLDKVGRRPYMLVPFSEGIRDVSGKNKTTLYKSLMGELKKDWELQSEKEAFSPAIETLTPAKRIFTQYYRPHQIKTGTVVAEKHALDDIARFVEIDTNGNEKVIFTPGYYFAGSLTYAADIMAWAEYAYDPRWENRNYSIIKMLNLKTGKVTILSKKSRYFSPSLSEDGERMVAVEVSENQAYKLVVIETGSGEVLQEFQSVDNDFFTYPSFSANGKKIVTIAVNDFGNRLTLFDIATGQMEYLMDTTYTEIFSPVFDGNKIVFVGAYSGINNLYQLDLETKKISQLSSVEFGVSDPFISNDGSVYFSNYTADGFELSKMAITDDGLKPLDLVEDNMVKLYSPLAEQAGEILEPSRIPQEVYETVKYAKWKNLFNFHSWAPLSIDANNYDVKPGVSVLSQNVLSSAFTSLGWEYDVNEQTGKYYFNFTYEGWYPALDFKADYGKRKSYTFDTADNRIDFSWMETNFSTNVRVPLNFTTNKYSRFVQPSIQLEYVQLDMEEDAQVSFKRNNYKALSYRLYASNLLKRTERDMNPRWGQIVDLNYRTAPFANDTLGSLVAAETRLYFPGILRHHSFNVYAGFQKRIDANPLFSSVVNYPRGFSGIYSDELGSLAVNYKFPVFYPDFSFSSLAYIKRIKANLFYDYANGSHRGYSEIYQSTGAELFADLHILRFLAPIELGYRFIYRPDYNDFKSEFLFSVNFVF